MSNQNDWWWKRKRDKGRLNRLLEEAHRKPLGGSWYRQKPDPTPPPVSEVRYSPILLTDDASILERAYEARSYIKNAVADNKPIYGVTSYHGIAHFRPKLPGSDHWPPVGHFLLLGQLSGVWHQS